MPKLSIITVNLNNAKGLKKTIDSIVNQTFNDYEYIIIDGGSTDSSFEIIRQYSGNIAYWVSEPDKGIYNAMNKGILKARGEYCLFLNSGDFLLKSDVLKRVFSIDYDEDIIYGNLYVNGVRRTFPETLSLLFFFQTSLGHPSTFIKTHLFREYGLYNEGKEIVSDWEFFLNMIINQKCTYKYLNDYDISYFEENGISSLNHAVLKKECETVLKKMYPIVYEDYVKYADIKAKLDYYENSKFFQLMKIIYDRMFVRLIRKAKGFK